MVQLALGSPVAALSDLWGSLLPDPKALARATLIPGPYRPLITSHAEVITDTPARYAKQLIAQLGRKLDFNIEDATSTTTIGEATGQVVVGDGSLILIATGVDVEAVAQVEHVLGSHLERFGQRNELTVT